MKARLLLRSREVLGETAFVERVLWLLPETRPDHDPDADRGLARGLFSERRALTTFLIWVVFGLDLLVTYLLLNWLPTLVVAKGFTAADGAAASLWFNAFSVMGALMLGWLADRIGFRWPLLAVFLVLAVFGNASMWMAVFADMGASLLVVVNGLRLLKAGVQSR